MTLLVGSSLSFLGLAALCLGMARHHQAVWSRPPDRARARTFRAAGWGLIALSLVAAIRSDGWNFGPVDWLGSLVGAGLLVIVVQSYRPRALLWLAPLATVVAVAGMVAGPG
jgi:hypothetical protein